MGQEFQIEERSESSMSLRDRLMERYSRIRPEWLQWAIPVCLATGAAAGGLFICGYLSSPSSSSQSDLDLTENQAKNTFKVQPPDQSIPINTVSPYTEPLMEKEDGMCWLGDERGYGFVDYGYGYLESPDTKARYPIIPPIEGTSISTVTLPEGCSPSEYTFWGNARAFENPFIFEAGQILQAFRQGQPLGTTFFSVDAYQHKMKTLPRIEYGDAMGVVK